MSNSSFAFSSSDHATFSKDFVLLSFVNDAECHYEWTGVRVRVIFTLENRAYELVKTKHLSHKLEGIGDSQIKTFPISFSFHMTTSLSI